MAEDVVKEKQKSNQKPLAEETGGRNFYACTFN
jgi:hypothetical protein